MGAELFLYGLVGLLPALLIGVLLGQRIARRSSDTAPGRPSVTPYLIVDGASAAIDWYHEVFDAAEITRWTGGAGRIAHAELRIGGSSIFLGDEHVKYEDIHAPPRIGGTPVYLDIETDHVAALFERAIAAGATEIRAPTDPQAEVQSAKVRDPFGHIWLITRSPEA